VSQVLPESTTTTSLGPSGGTANSADGLVLADRAGGAALSSDVAVVIETDTHRARSPTSSAPRYRVLPNDLRFAVPATARRRLGARLGR
jgi:hypothetical protein